MKQFLVCQVHILSISFQTLLQRWCRWMASLFHHLRIHLKLRESLHQLLLSAPSHGKGEVEELAEVEQGRPLEGALPVSVELYQPKTPKKPQLPFHLYFVI